MSQEQLYILLRTFGPIPSKGMAAAFGQASGTVQSALKRLKRHGDAKYIRGCGRTGRSGLWDAI